MQKRYVIKKTSNFFNKTYNEMHMLMKKILSGNISYNLVQTSDISVIAKAIYCRKYLTIDTRFRTVSTIEDNVIYSLEPIFVGEHKKYLYRDPNSKDIRHFRKCSFDTHINQIILIKTTEKSFETDFKEVDTYTVYVYKHDEHMKVEKPRYLDLQKQVPFALNEEVYQKCRQRKLKF